MEARGLRPEDLAADRNYQPARNHGGVARENWEARLQRDCLAGYARGSRGRGVRCAWRTGTLSRAKTGLPLATYFSGLKIRWILENVAGARAQAEAGDLLFGNIDTFLIWNLTGGADGGVHVTDVTNASRTQLMNLEHAAMGSEKSCGTSTFRSAMLPKIVSSSEVYGGCKAAGCRRSCDCRRSRRSASGSGWPSLLQARRSEEYLRHRLFHADEHGRKTRCARTSVC